MGAENCSATMIQIPLEKPRNPLLHKRHYKVGSNRAGRLL